MFTTNGTAQQMNLILPQPHFFAESGMDQLMLFGQLKLKIFEGRLRKSETELKVISSNMSMALQCREKQMGHWF